MSIVGKTSTLVQYDALLPNDYDVLSRAYDQKEAIIIGQISQGKEQEYSAVQILDAWQRCRAYVDNFALPSSVWYEQT